MKPISKRAIAVAVGLALSSAGAFAQWTATTGSNGQINNGPNPNLPNQPDPGIDKTTGNNLLDTTGNGGPGGVSGTYGKTADGQANKFGTGVLGSAHDFVSGTGNITNANNVAGLCTYCHTPHKGSSTLLLWNHTLSSNTFQWDVAATTAGTALPGFSGSTYQGPSAKCLSCHDGSVAIGDIGWFNQNTRTGTNALNTTKMGTDNPGGTAMQVGASGVMTGTHPVAIPYPLNGAPNVYNGSTTGARLATNDFVSDPTANNIRLYSDVGGGTIVGKVQAGKTGIECSSCHDPHNKAAVDDLFLRGKLIGSSQTDGYICLQCHQK